MNAIETANLYKEINDAEEIVQSMADAAKRACSDCITEVALQGGRLLRARDNCQGDFDAVLAVKCPRVNPDAAKRYIGVVVKLSKIKANDPLMAIQQTFFALNDEEHSDYVPRSFPPDIKATQFLSKFAACLESVPWSKWGEGPRERAIEILKPIVKELGLAA